MFFRKVFPSVAVIIPVYNVTDFLEEAISSAVNQKYPDVEVIVVDDGSLPQEAENIKNICSKFERVRLIRQENHGAAHARDTGVENTKAEYIVFLDGDDILRPKAISYLVRALSKNPDTIASYARLAIINEHGKILKKPKRFSFNRPSSGREILYGLLRGNLPFSNGTICISRQALQSLYKKNHGLTIGEDWVLWCQLALLGDIIPAGKRVVLNRRKHKENSSLIFLKNPSIIDNAHNIIFRDPLFSSEIGRERLYGMEKECLSRRNLYLATKYIENSQKYEAQVAFKKATIPLSSFN